MIAQISPVHGDLTLCIQETPKQVFMQIVKTQMNYCIKKSEYDQEIPQSQTADNPVAPRGRAAQPSRDTRKTN